MLDETRFHDIRCDDCGTLLARHPSLPMALSEASVYHDGRPSVFSHRCVTCRAFVREWEPADVLDRLARAFRRHQWCEALVVTDAGIMARFDEPPEMTEEELDEMHRAATGTADAVGRWLRTECRVVYSGNDPTLIDLRPLRGKRQQP